MDRRGFIRLSGKAGLAVAIAPLASGAGISRNEAERIDGIIEDEPFLWTGIRVFDYAGRITQRDALSKVSGSWDMAPGEIERRLSKFDHTARMPTFISPDRSIFAFEKFVKPKPSEMRDYRRFVDSMPECRGLEDIRAIYERFQERTGGRESYNTRKRGWNFYGDAPLHPAVLVSGRAKGICGDKAFALSEVYSNKGARTMLAEGVRLQGGKPVCVDGRESPESHMWTRLYAEGTFLDLDPTFYTEFRALRRQNCGDFSDGDWIKDFSYVMFGSGSR
ncbi:MAG: hypothetical protein HY518_05185 [Candidatus Aenigmarchaeota archaeon]|nr:hypothetical protein [Candidatus Aenigmarchaeota archaeon]